MVGRKLLVAGNNAGLLQEITAEFRSRGCWVNTATNVAQGIQRLFQDHPHMVIIDTGDEARDWDGWKLYRNIKEIADVPVIMLTPPNGPSSRVEALKLGADDSLDHPVNLEELILRAVALLQRSNSETRIPFAISGGLWIDFRSRRVWARDSVVDLTPREFQLLTYLIENTDRPLSHEEILEQVWGDDASGSWIVRQVVHKLRRKIEPDPARPRYILTRRGIGYQFARGAR